MTKDEFDRAKSEINHRPLTDFYQLTPSGTGMFNCPICESGTGPKHTGALKLYNNNGEYRVICYSQGCFGNSKGQTSSTLDALCKLWHMEAKDVMQRLGYETASTISTTSTTTNTDKATKQPEPKADYTQPPGQDFTANYEKWHQDLLQNQAAMSYLQGRGINEATINALNLGYANIGYGKKESFKAPRIIIPYSADFYHARRIDGISDAKYIPSGGGKHLYNTAAFQDNGEDGQDNKLMPIFVVEGEMNAIALWQGGYKRVIAIGPADNYKEFAKQAAKINPAAVYVLALDNDPEDKANPQKGQTGQKAQAKLADQLQENGIDYLEADTARLYGEYTDAADAILHMGESFWGPFWDEVNRGYVKRQQRDEAAAREAYYRSGPGMVDAFLEGAKSERNRPIPCGITSIDNALGGGFCKQNIVIIGGEPGIGKTAFVTQLCESMAEKQGADILYFNFEMSREQLLARSLARMMYRDGHKGIKATTILRGYDWTEEQEKSIRETAEKYKRKIANHMIYNPGEETTDLDSVLEKIQDEKKRIGRAPIVVIDYLHLITSTANGRSEDPVETMKRAMQKFKEYAMKEYTTVFVISANNRESNKSGRSGLTSGRDTSNIEYGADVHLGLEFGETRAEREIARKKYDQNPRDKAAKEDYERKKSRRRLRVNKTRFGDPDAIVKLQFVGACALFNEESNREEPPEWRNTRNTRDTEWDDPDSDDGDDGDDEEEDQETDWSKYGEPIEV